MEKKMWYVKSFNFTGWNAEKTCIEGTKKQIDEMVERCSINTVCFALGALQDHAYSTEIDWKGPHMFKDEQVVELIRYAKSKDLKVILKPMINTRDGYWRGYIHFFDEDVPCEPKWGDWFKSNTEYMTHFAEICEKESVEMLMVGCEMVGTDHRDKEWRELVKEVRKVYSGLVTYNCDKYQEHNVKWWDALDVISSSGYYPDHDWDNQLKRIEAVVKKYNKPFFFAETGCPSTETSIKVPNDWTRVGKNPVSYEEQDRFFKTMFESCDKLDWHYGYTIWDWAMNARSRDPQVMDGGYSVIDKPSQNTIKEYFDKKA